MTIYHPLTPLNSSLTRGLDEHKKAIITQKNLRLSTTAPQNRDILTKRTGPPLLTPTELHTLASWRLHEFQTRENNDIQFDAPGDGEHLSRVERYLRSPLVPLPAYSNKFRNYNDHLWELRQGGIYLCMCMCMPVYIYMHV